MSYENPEITFNFINSSSQVQSIVVEDDQIVKDSITFEYQLMSKELKSSTNRIKFTLVPECSVGSVNVTARILAWQYDIQVVLRINNTVRFTGYLTSKFNWVVNSTGEQCLALTAEDNNYLLDKVYSDTDNYINKVALNSIPTGYNGLIKDICDVCGITIANAQSLNKTITAVIKADAKCKDILSEVCYELGHVYRFNAQGKLELYKIGIASLPAQRTQFSGSNLLNVKNNGVELNKTLRQYNKSIVKYKKYNGRQNSKIYQDISGQDAEHPNCNISIPPGTSYPSGMNISGTTPAQRTSYVECCDLTEGKELITIGDTIYKHVTASSQYGLDVYMAKSSAKKIGVRIDNNSANTIVLSQLEANADIIYEDSDNKVIAGVSTGKAITEELNYVHTDTEAKEFANLLAQYYQNSNREYVFYSRTSVNVGDIVDICESVHTLVSSTILIRCKTEDNKKNYYKYTGTSISPFRLDAQTIDSGATTSPTIVVGPAGKDGEDGEDGEPGPQGPPGEPGDARIFNLIVQSKTYKRNMRRSGNQDPISVSTTYEGYTSPSINITCSVPNIYSNGVLRIPYKNTYDIITITATLTATELTEPIVKVETLNVDDVTPLPMFIGCVTSMPSTTSEGDIINGDYFCVKSQFSSGGSTYLKGECYRKIEGGWERMTARNSQASEMLNCLNGFKTEGVSLQSISDHDAISWFNEIVADQLIVDTIKGNSAFFDNIEIGSNSTLKGKIDGDVLKTITSSGSSSSYVSDGRNPVVSFRYDDVASYLTTVSKTVGNLYQATGTIEGATPSYMIYFNSTPTGYDAIASASTLTQELTIETPSYPKVYKMGCLSSRTYIGMINGEWRIYNGSTLESSGTIITEERTSSSQSITQFTTTPVVQAGRTLKIAPQLSGATIERFEVRAYNADNFSRGTNVICSNGRVYNIGSSSGLSHISYLTDYGRNLKLQVAYSSVWVQCDGSAWNSSIPKYAGFTGRTDGGASTGSGTINTIANCYANFSNGTRKDWTSSNVTSVVWGVDYIQFYNNGSSVGGITSSDSLSSWYINFTVNSYSAGLETKGMNPWQTGGPYDLGTLNRRWGNIYCNNLNTNSFTTSTLDVTTLNATQLYGVLGSSSNVSNAFINALRIYSGLTYGSSGVNLLSPYQFEKWDDSGGLQGRIIIPGLGGGSMKIFYGYTTTIPGSISSYEVTCSFGIIGFTNLNYFVAGIYESPQDQSGIHAGACTVKTRANDHVVFINEGGPSNATKIIWLAIGY